MFSPELKKGSVELMVLSVIEDEPRHGYEIGKLIERLSGGQIRFHLTSLYPVLYRMENRNWISGHWIEKPGVRRRCYYSLTADGGQILARKREQWWAFTIAVNNVIGGGVIGVEHA